MKKNLHPAYAPVVFRDRATGTCFLTRSTLDASRTTGSIELDGRTYPVLDVDTTSDSHPFWTGTARVMDSEGRVDRFRRRYGSGS